MAQHARKDARLQVATANRLTDGEVVYLTCGGAWSESLADARVAQEPRDAAVLLEQSRKDEEACLVVEVYLFEVRQDPDGVVRPVSVREQIRMAGPTVRLDLGKQAAGGGKQATGGAQAPPSRKAKPHVSL